MSWRAEQKKNSAQSSRRRVAPAQLLGLQRNIQLSGSCLEAVIVNSEAMGVGAHKPLSE